jgi:hypothetical protein
MVLLFDIIMEWKRKSKNDDEAKESCKVMTLDEQINIPDKLFCDNSAGAVGLTFSWYFILKFEFPLILYFSP